MFNKVFVLGGAGTGEFCWITVERVWRIHWVPECNSVNP